MIHSMAVSHDTLSLSTENVYKSMGTYRYSPECLTTKKYLKEWLISSSGRDTKPGRAFNVLFHHARLRSRELLPGNF